MKLRMVGAWGDTSPDPGKRRVKPEGYGALDKLGQALAAADGVYASATVPIAAVDVQALGKALRRIAKGEDARHLFAQIVTPGRQSASQEQAAVAAICRERRRAPACRPRRRP